MQVSTAGRLKREARSQGDCDAPKKALAGGKGIFFHGESGVHERTYPGACGAARLACAAAESCSAVKGTAARASSSGVCDREEKVSAVARVAMRPWARSLAGGEVEAGETGDRRSAESGAGARGRVEGRAVGQEGLQGGAQASKGQKEPSEGKLTGSESEAARRRSSWRGVIASRLCPGGGAPVQGPWCCTRTIYLLTHNSVCRGRDIDVARPPPPADAPGPLPFWTALVQR